MAIVKYIKELKSGRISVGVDLDGESVAYSIPKSEYGKMSFTVGGVLDGEELSHLASLDGEYRAIKKALSLLSCSDKNKRELYARLVREGYSREHSRAAVEYCLMHGYIKEDDQLRRLILREANVNLRGPRYIREKLAAKGYSRDGIDAVTDGLLESGEIDFAANFNKLCEKKGAFDPDERRALAYKYGFRTE